MQRNPDQTQWLLDRAREGDQAAFGELFQRHRANLRLTIALRMDRRVAARVDASDVLQDTYLEAFKRLPKYLQHQGMPFQSSSPASVAIQIEGSDNSSVVGGEHTTLIVSESRLVNGQRLWTARKQQVDPLEVGTWVDPGQLIFEEQWPPGRSLPGHEVEIRAGVHVAGHDLYGEPVAVRHSLGMESEAQQAGKRQNTSNTDEELPSWNFRGRSPDTWCLG